MECRRFLPGVGGPSAWAAGQAGNKGARDLGREVAGKEVQGACSAGVGLIQGSRGVGYNHDRQFVERRTCSHPRGEFDPTHSRHILNP